MVAKCFSDLWNKGKDPVVENPNTQQLHNHRMTQLFMKSILMTKISIFQKRELDYRLFSADINHSSNPYFALEPKRSVKSKNSKVLKTKLWSLELKTKCHLREKLLRYFLKLLDFQLHGHADGVNQRDGMNGIGFRGVPSLWKSHSSFWRVTYFHRSDLRIGFFDKRPSKTFLSLSLFFF